MAALGEWVNYAIKPVEVTVTGSGGTWDTDAIVAQFNAGYMLARVTNLYAYQNLAGYTYDIDVTHDSSNDTFKWRKKAPGGSYGSYQYVDGGSTEYPISNPNKYSSWTWAGNYYWISIDPGVQIWFSSLRGFDGNESIQFTLPSGPLLDSQKKFINGFTTCLAVPTDAGDNEYTSNIPKFHGEGYTVIFNYSLVDLLTTGAAGNQGLTLRFNYSGDGTNYELGFASHDDLPLHNADIVGHIGTFDKKASGREDYKTVADMGSFPLGGDYPHNRMELLFADLEGDESTIADFQYLDIALIKND